MDYPQEILPHPNYKFIDCDLSDHYLIRVIDTSNQELFWDQETKSVILKYLFSGTDKIDDLSMSLLDVYKTQHVFIELTDTGKEKFKDYCEPDEVVHTPQFPDDFISNPDKYYWCAPVNRLHKVQFDYTRSNAPFTATCFVKHTPTKWNFWHFSLLWDTDLGPLDQLEEKTRKKVATRIGHSARVIITQFAIIHEPEHSALPQNCYCKN